MESWLNFVESILGLLVILYGSVLCIELGIHNPCVAREWLFLDVLLISEFFNLHWCNLKIKKKKNPILAPNCKEENL